MTNINYSTLPSYLYKARKTSAFTSFKGSMTVEAAMAVPVFFFAVICLIYLFEVMSVQIAVKDGISYAGKIVMQESYPAAVISTERIEQEVINAIGAERLERSIVEGGSTGIDCSDSSVSLLSGIGNITAEYTIHIPVPFFRMNGITRKESIRIKTWTGYEKGFSGWESDEIVYITETGLVYHKDYHCTYLDLSIRMVSAQDIENLRNENGGKYYACRSCSGTNTNHVYITTNGNKYHSSLNCSGLKRTVYAVKLSEVTGKGACTRCGR